MTKLDNYSKKRSNVLTSISLLICALVVFTLQTRAQVTNYYFSASSGTYTPLSSGTVATLSTGNNDDGYYGNIPLGFDFTYDGNVYNTISANTNGWLSLNNSTTTIASEQNNLSSGLDRPILAPLWDDHSMALGAFTYFSDTTVGATDSVFTAEWKDVNWQAQGGAVISFQVKLYKSTGTIEFIYNQEPQALSNPVSASIGITSTGTGSGNFLSLSDAGTSPSMSSTVETTSISSKPASGQIYTFYIPTPAAPSIITGTNTLVTSTGASLSGDIAPNTAPTVTASGVVVSTSPSPVIGNMGVMDFPSSPLATTGTFAVNATGLTLGTLYYYSAYATNAMGTTYGADSTFTTLSTAVAPTVTTDATVNITQTTATVAGTIVSDGGDAIIASGIVYGTTATPALGDLGVVDSTTTPLVLVAGSYSFNLTGLTLGTTYYARAYAINGVDTAYGADDMFTTDPATAPSVTTDAVSNVAQTTVTIAGTIVSDGGDAITASGIVYGTTATPALGDLGVVDSTTTPILSAAGSYSFAITGLTASTQYFYRAYAINGVDTAYGSDVSFTTLATALAADVTTDVTTSVAQTTATIGGTIVSDGGSAITASGVVYGTNPTPTLGDLGVVDSTTTPLVSSAGSYSFNITGLTLGTTYYARAYAINGVDTAYGLNDTFTTNPATLPTVTTDAVSNVAQTTATIAGIIVSDGGDAITASGIVYGTTASPALGDAGVVDSTTTPLVSSAGSYSFAITGLTASTQYFYRAYAINGVDTAYGLDVDFTTLTPAVAPTVTTDASANITQTTATVAGIIVSDGGDAITASGIVYGTNPTPALGDLGVVDSTTTPLVSTVGSYSFNITGLTLGTTYYARAYAINGVDTAYGADDMFTTDPATAPSVTTDAVSNVAQTTATIAGTIVSDGGDVITASGIVYGTSANPTLGDLSVVDSTTTPLVSSAGSYSFAITGLTASTQYFYRAYAINGVDTAYGLDVSFTTSAPAIVAPTVQASAVATNNITNTTIDVSWTNGDGSSRIVVARLTTASAVTPVDGTTYTADASFGAGSTTGTDNYVVYAGTGSSVTVTDLALLTDYTFTVYEMNGSAATSVFLTPGASNTGTTLPVTLTTFNGKNVNGDVVLNWITVTETNNNGFNVEKSVDGKNFTTVTFVKGSGNSTSTNNYAAVDAKAFATTQSNVLFYRLKQVDFNGNFQYSQVVTVNRNATATTINVYPNPFVSTLSFDLFSTKDTKATVTVTDVNGSEISTSTIDIVAGNQTNTIHSLENVSNGIYFVKVTMVDGETKVVRVSKMN
jgi:hypothetical protein